MRWTLYTLFILSGFAGLVYQSIWSHYLGLYLGHSAYAQSVVLIVFMGGLALGAWLASHFSKKMPLLLVAYAAIEGIIGVFGLLFDPIFKTFLAFSLDTVFGVLDSNLVDAYRWSSASLLILPQTILLGMTFPIMSAVFLRSQPEKSGENLGMLYFTNSIGAAVGALASVFLLLPFLGLPGTIFTAGLLNIAVAIVAYGIAKYTTLGDPLPIFARPQPENTAKSSSTSSNTRLWLLLLLSAVFFTGLASFIYEIAWIRMLSMVLGSTIYAFEIMLSAFIAGLAFGGLWIRKRLDTMQHPLLWAGTIQILMGVFAVATLWVYGQSFSWMQFILTALDNNDSGFALFSILSHGLALLIMLPATFFAGMTLPLFTQILLKKAGQEASVGQVYAINTFGAIVGVLIAVHWLLPSFGLKSLLAVGAFVDIILGIVLLISAQPGQQSRRFVAIALLGLGFWLGMTQLVDLDPRQLSSGVYRYERTEIPESNTVAFLADGKTATISVIQNEANDYQAILTNGKPDSGLRRFRDGSAPPNVDEYTTVLLGLLGPSYYPEAKTAAVIGFGTGMTTQTLLSLKSISQVDTIEIEPAVIEGAKVFLPRIAKTYEDPRSKIHIDDAKAFFAKNQARYDLIISEPSNPWISGVASLFSEEFYQRLDKSLTPDGLFIQWVQLYEINESLLASVFKGLSAHFDDYVVFNSNGFDLLIIAKKSGRLPEFTDFAWQHPDAVEELKSIAITDPSQITARLVGRKTTLDLFFQEFTVPAHSDFYPVLSLQAPRSLFLKDRVNAITQLQLNNFPVQELLGGNKGLSLAWSLEPDPFLTYGNEIKITRDLYRAIRSPEEPAYLRHDLRYLPWQVQQSCQTFMGEEEWRSNLFTLAMLTLNFLPDNERRDLWTNLDWLNCPTPSAESQTWLTLYQAVAKRDAATILALSTTMLNSQLEKLTDDEIRFLFDGALTTALLLREPFKGRELMKNLRGKLPDLTPSNNLLVNMIFYYTR